MLLQTDDAQSGLDALERGSSVPRDVSVRKEERKALL